MKAIIAVTEKLEYQREIPFILPEDMSEDELEMILDKVQRQADCTEDFIYGLRDYGIIQQGSYDSSYDIPSYSEVDCDEYEIVDEHE